MRLGESVTEVQNTQKFSALSQILDTATDAVLAASQGGDPSQVKKDVRGILMFWLGIAYDEGMIRVAQVEQQVELLLSLVEKLQENSSMIPPRWKGDEEP